MIIICAFDIILAANEVMLTDRFVHILRARFLRTYLPLCLYNDRLNMLQRINSLTWRLCEPMHVCTMNISLAWELVHIILLCGWTQDWRLWPLMAPDQREPEQLFLRCVSFSHAGSRLTHKVWQGPGHACMKSERDPGQQPEQRCNKSVKSSSVKVGLYFAS